MKKFVGTLMFIAVLLVCGTACVQNGKKDAAPHNFAEVDKKPMFNGEEAGKFGSWVFDQIQYPEEAFKNGSQGRVTLQFVISKKGKVKDVKVVKSSGNELLDNEALRVVSMSPAWTPGEVAQKPVDVLFTFPVVFKIMGEPESENAQGAPVPYSVVEQKPTFMGKDPNSDFGKWVFSQVKYPEEATKNNIQGRVTLQFTIAKDGKVKDVTIARSSGNELLDNEALRVISMSPQWEPGKQGGEPVNVKFTFPLVFQLR